MRESQIDNVDGCRWIILDMPMEMGSAQDRRIIEGRFEGLGRDFFLDLKTECYRFEFSTSPLRLQITSLRHFCQSRLIPQNLDSVALYLMTERG